MGWQADRGKMGGGARGFRSCDQLLMSGKFERQSHPQRHCLTVQQAVGEPAAGFQRMAESLAEIEQRALASLALVARNSPGLGAAADCNRMLARRAAGKHILPVLLKPG